MKDVILVFLQIISIVVGIPLGIKLLKWLRNNFIFFGSFSGLIVGAIFCVLLPVGVINAILVEAMDSAEKNISEITKPKYEKYIDKANEEKDFEEKIKYLKKSLKKEYNTQALKEIRDILVSEVYVGENYEKYLNMVKSELKKKDINKMYIEVYSAFAGKEFNAKNYDKAMEYLEKAENLGMNIEDSHVYWEIKEMKDYERKQNNQYDKINPDTVSEDIKAKYIDKLDAINNEVNGLRYGETTLEMKETSLKVFKKWDDALNEIYNKLKNKLSSSEMERLKKSQQDWIKRRDKRAKEDSLKSEGSSMEEIEYIESLSRTTKERCYELVENYLN